MSMLFSEYLVDRKNLKSEQVLESLIEQLRSTPGIAEILYDKEIIPKDDLFKILTYQQKYNLDFRTSAENLGLWSNEISGNLEKIIDGLKKPLTEIFIEKGFLNLDDLSPLVVSYTEALNSSNGSVPNQSTPLQSKTLVAVENKNTQIQNDVEYSIFDSILTKEFINNLEKKAVPEIQSSLASFEKQSLSFMEYFSLLKNIMSGFIIIRAGATFLGATQSECIAGSVVKLLESIQNIKITLNQSILLRILNDSIFLLDSISKSLQMNFSESVLSTDNNIKSLYSSFLKKVYKLQTILNLILELEEDISAKK